MCEFPHNPPVLCLKGSVDKVVKLKNNAAKIDHEKTLKMPEVYQDYCSEEVLVMEFLDGVPFNKLQKDQIEKIYLKFSERRIKYVLTKPLHGSQKMDK
mgnify:CR=1 FL=1